uniref:HECT domain-containing protein n=1 Tax=Sphenodon punctatus TaxID=8508 RepID=A0A8D0GY35_SPHPU
WGFPTLDFRGALLIKCFLQALAQLLELSECRLPVSSVGVWLFKKSEVGFQGEPGVYDGGLSQEFFTIIARELCAPETEIFRNFEESHLIWFPSKAPVMEDVYFLIGTLFGMALYNMKIAALPFPLALYKKMLNIQPTLK